MTVRRNTYKAVSTKLSQLSDHELGEAIASGTVRRTGIGGRKAELDIDGTRIFVKRVPVTDIELENMRSTANLLDLPTFYQYGLGSAGFSAWRELDTHIMTTKWVLDGEYDDFPLMYHWRILPDSPPEGFADDFGGIDGTVAHWDGSPAVRRRLEAIGSATSSLVLCLEHIPQTLHSWLRDGGDIPWTEQVLTRGAAFMSSRRLVHFDTHFNNILTDGERIYFADFGLALSSGFDLTKTEAEFLENHLAYDHSYAVDHLIRSIHGDVQHEVFLRDWVAGRRPDGLPPEAVEIIDRHAVVARLLDTFHRRMMKESKQIPFPAAQIEQALASRPDTTG